MVITRQDAGSPQSVTPRTSRHFRVALFQYRLRSLLIVMAMCAALFSWWSYSARRQREAAEKLTSNRSGFAVYDVDMPGGVGRWPKWLLTPDRRDFLAPVVAVYLFAEPTPETVKQLKLFPSLRLVVLKRYPAASDVKLMEGALPGCKISAELLDVNQFGEIEVLVPMGAS